MRTLSLEAVAWWICVLFITVESMNKYTSRNSAHKWPVLLTSFSFHSVSNHSLCWIRKKIHPHDEQGKGTSRWQNSRKKIRTLILLHCGMSARLFFFPPGLDADGGSALGPKGNSSLHTPSTFFQQEKYYPQKQKYTMTKKNLSWFRGR